MRRNSFYLYVTSFMQLLEFNRTCNKSWLKVQYFLRYSSWNKVYFLTSYFCIFCTIMNTFRTSAVRCLCRRVVGPYTEKYEVSIFIHFRVLIAGKYHPSELLWPIHLDWRYLRNVMLGQQFHGFRWMNIEYLFPFIKMEQLCYIEWMLLISIYSECNFMLWSRNTRQITLGVKYIDGELKVINTMRRIGNRLTGVEFNIFVNPPSIE